MILGMFQFARILAAVVPLALASCGPSATAGGFDSANPAARMYAIEQAARSNDRPAIRRIVEQLESDDPAVRCLAISALKRMTGETYGYRDYDPPELRREAVQRWVEAVKTGSVESKARESEPPPSSFLGHPVATNE
jgi:HEAT repeat protein